MSLFIISILIVHNYGFKIRAINSNKSEVRRPETEVTILLY